MSERVKFIAMSERVKFIAVSERVEFIAVSERGKYCSVTRGRRGKEGSVFQVSHVRKLVC